MMDYIYTHSIYPLVMTQIAMENGPCIVDLPKEKHQPW